jgi:hypothetical protein
MRNVTTNRPDRSSVVDVCSSLMQVCHACQAELLNPKGITCLIDIDGGNLAAWRCNIIGRLVRALIEEISQAVRPGARGGRVTVALHHKGEVWVLAVADEGVRSFDRSVPVDATAPVLHLARPLKGTCRTRQTPRGAVTAVLFTVKQPARVTADWRSALATPAEAARRLLPMGRSVRSLPRRVLAYH